MRSPSTRNPLAPLEFVLAFGTGFFVFVLLLVTGAATFGSGSFNTDVCVRINNGTAATVSDKLDNPANSAAEAIGDQSVLPSGTTVLARKLDVCARKPTTAQRLVSGGDGLMGLLLLAVPIALSWRLVRRARARGVFSSGVARALTQLGAWVLIASAVFSVLTLLADNWLIDQLLPGGGRQPVDIPLSWGTLLTGFGLLALGRVMASAVSMQEELDATV